MTKLIADSGSTKTDWCICQQSNILQQIATQGLNPYHQSPHEIATTINDMASQVVYPEAISHIEFYGAGCALPQKSAIVAGALQEVFPQCQSIYVASDLEGAAKAVCKNLPGIACILGTGSNSCQFDGTHIVANTPSLGYILGDEGSGASLGRIMVGDLLKGQLPKDLCHEFFNEYNLDQAALLDSVYRQPLANRYLASFTPFLAKHRSHPAIHALLVGEFTRFFQRNVLAYDTTLPVHFVGSIAHHFSQEVSEAAQALKLTIGQTLRTPIDGLTGATSAPKGAEG